MHLQLTRQREALKTMTMARMGNVLVSTLLQEKKTEDDNIEPVDQPSTSEIGPPPLV